MDTSPRKGEREQKQELRGLSGKRKAPDHSCRFLFRKFCMRSRRRLDRTWKGTTKQRLFYNIADLITYVDWGEREEKRKGLKILSRSEAMAAELKCWIKWEKKGGKSLLARLPSPLSDCNRPFSGLPVPTLTPPVPASQEAVAIFLKYKSNHATLLFKTSKTFLLHVV